MAHGEHSEILEKPPNKNEQLRLLDLMAGRSCEVVTAVCIGGYHQPRLSPADPSVYPTVEHPGFKLQSINQSTIVHFYDNDIETIKAYVEHGEGHDRAGGFAIQGLGGLLIEKIEGDYDNCVGFPNSAFWRWMAELDEDGTFDDI